MLCVSRTQSELDETVRLAGPRAFALALDVSAPDAADRMLTGLQASASKLDILVHCAGIMQAGTMEQLDLANFDRAFAINVRAPYALTRAAMVSLKCSRGQILFVNSSIVRASNTAGRGVHAAAQAALKAIADSLRDEINDSGVRVLSIMPGRTATPREEQRCAAEGRPYRPDRLLQARRRRTAQTLRRARPLDRRAESTLRPPTVCMRLRKPCLRARRSFEG